VKWNRGDDVDKTLLFDPQTSGGLLVSIEANRAADYVSRVEGAVVIGEIIHRGDVAIEVR
jgi:selenophosphate synthase